jgi:transposase
LLEHFVAGTPARTTAEIVGVHRNSAIRFFHKLREKIARKQLNRSEQFYGNIELDESYFGGMRKGKRGRGSADKIPVFGILKRGGKVYTQIIEDAKSTTLMPIIRDKIMPDSIVYTDCFKSYNALDVSEFKHFRINHSKLFAHKHNHINGIENFWNQAKRHLRKYNGIPRKNFYLFLKECE